MKTSSTLLTNDLESDCHDLPIHEIESRLVSWPIFFLLLMIFILPFAVSGQTLYPIPSYDVLIKKGANFQELKPVNGKTILEKRKVYVHSSCTTLGLGSCSASVWVYSLDGRTILGPYLLVGDDLISVDIDEREWGVYVIADSPINIDVWIE